MKNPRLASLLIPMLMVLPQFIHIAYADDFGPNGEPSADIVNHMATDDVPSQNPNGDNSADTSSDQGQAGADNGTTLAPQEKKDDGNALPPSTPPSEQKAAPETTSYDYQPTGVPVARF